MVEWLDHTAATTPVAWVVDSLVARGTVTILAGQPGAGKSLLAQALAVQVATRGDRVLIVDAENGKGVLSARFTAMGLPVAAQDRLRVGEFHGFDLDDTDHLDELIRANPCDLLVLDSWVSLWAGSERSVPAVRAVLEGLRAVAARHDVAVLLIHHSTKGGNTYRGSSAVAGVVEGVFLLTRGEGDARTLSCDKLRIAQEPPPCTFALADVMRGRVPALRGNIVTVPGWDSNIEEWSDDGGDVYPGLVRRAWGWWRRHCGSEFGLDA